MSWAKIVKGEIGETQPEVKVGSTARSKPATHGQMVVHLSASVARAAGLRPGDRIQLEVGTLADDGWMRISKGNEQKTMTHGGDGSLRVRFSGRRFGVTGTYKMASVKYQIHTHDGRQYVTFMLPKWARKGVEGGPRSEEREQG